MGKYIVLVVTVVVLYALIRSSLRRRAAKRSARREHQDGPRLAEDMVRCAHCGIHLPRGECLLANGATYCSAEHRRLREGGTG
jgi:uncharacterized protein